MLLNISDGVLVCLKYLSKHRRLHQGLDYIVYSQYCIEFDCITSVLKVLMFSVYVIGC